MEWSTHLIFIVCSALGGILLIFQILLSFLGSDGGDLDGLGDSAAPGTTDLSFKMLSIQGIAAFLTMFGLVGLALSKTFALNPLINLLGASAAGILSYVMIAQIYAAVGRLQSSGTLSLEKAIGCTGTVYLRIEPEKPGKITFTLQGRQQTMEAVTTEAKVFETGQSIRITGVRGDGLLEVTSL